jgi:hypothetical protein
VTAGFRIALIMARMVHYSIAVAITVIKTISDGQTLMDLSEARLYRLDRGCFAQR